MHDFLTSHTEEVRHLCEKFKVKRLSAFGSACTENFTQNSDIDLLYLFDSDRVPLIEYADNFLVSGSRCKNYSNVELTLSQKKHCRIPIFAKR
jgi:hypothetical protein